MKYLAVLVCTVIICAFAQAQTYEVGAFIGGANFIGDVGNTSFISPNAPAIGGIFKWNRSSRHAFRFSALFAQLDADDADSNENGRQGRGLEFENNIFEASLGLEYTFWEFDLFSEDKVIQAPYLYTGITVINQNDLFLNANNVILSDGNVWNVVIPMIVGYKIALNRELILAVELGARYGISDNLDGSNPSNDDTGATSFGNLNNDDWYFVTGLTLTYTFGRKPCFCAF